MFDLKFVGLFDASGLTLGSFLLCMLTALVLGVIVALSWRYRCQVSRSLTLTLASLPAIVAVVIMMVGGNLGTGLAVAGTFSMVRFRSMPGTAREICAVFLSVAVGLACGAGYPVIGVILTVVMALFNLLMASVKFGGKAEELRKSLRITVPEDLDYADVFSDILAEFTSQSKLVGVKTTNLGSLNKLAYEITLKKAGTEKEMIDQLRCRNGNLEISISAAEMNIRDI